METRQPTYQVSSVVISLTLLAVFAGLFIPRQFVEIHLTLFGVLLVLAGVPHGASDVLLCRQLLHRQGKASRLPALVAGYCLLVAAYAVVWWLAPVLALAVFLGVSAYHFGQSNWAQQAFLGKIWERATMLLWGAAVIGVPVLLHFEQASAIIFEMTGWQPQLSANNRAALIFLLIFSVVGMLLQLRQRQVLSPATFRTELRNFGLLMILFFATPLLVGFGVYFVLWHSVGAVRDQMEVIRAGRPGFAWRGYLRSIMPLSLVAFAGLAGLYFFWQNQSGQGGDLGLLFLFISVITVPHAALMEWVYHRRQDSETTGATKTEI